MTVISIRKDPEILTMTITAELDVGVERAWQLWADPRQLERWWGAPSFAIGDQGDVGVAALGLAEEGAVGRGRSRPAVVIAAAGDEDGRERGRYCQQGWNRSSSKHARAPSSSMVRGGSASIWTVPIGAAGLPVGSGRLRTPRH